MTADFSSWQVRQAPIVKILFCSSIENDLKSVRVETIDSSGEFFALPAFIFGKGERNPGILR